MTDPRETNRPEFSDYALSMTGETGYKGPYYYVDHDRDGILRTRLACLGFAVFITAAYIVGGLSGFSGSSALYVMIPYIAFLLPLALMLSSLLYAIPFAKKMTPLQFKRGYGRMRICSWLLLGLDIAAVLAEIVFIIAVCQKSERGGEMVFVSCGALIAVFITVFISFQKRIPIKLTEAPADKKENSNET